MISAFGAQQTAYIATAQQAGDNATPSKSYNHGGSHSSASNLASSQIGARQAHDKAATQITSAYLDTLAGKIAEEPNKGANNAGALTGLAAAEYENSVLAYGYSA